MNRKRIAASMFVGVLGLAVLTTGVSSAAPGPYDQPPSLTLVPKVLNKARFKLKKTITVGTETCGTGNCQLVVNRVFAAVRNSDHFKATVIAPTTLKAGQSAPIKIKLTGATFNKIVKSKTGHGHAKFNLTLFSSVGYASINKKGNARYQGPKKP
ncbi:MAG: hypothetical protein QOD60_731 [Solirubrobacterales bacterium]|jgi:hypothetical protein|nr:hypothetical protein [Solirubrobacterales bacterium]